MLAYSVLATLYYKHPEWMSLTCTEDMVKACCCAGANFCWLKSSILAYKNSLRLHAFGHTAIATLMYLGFEHAGTGRVWTSESKQHQAAHSKWTVVFRRAWAVTALGTASRQIQIVKRSIKKAHWLVQQQSCISQTLLTHCWWSTHFSYPFVAQLSWCIT